MHGTIRNLKYTEAFLYFEPEYIVENHRSNPRRGVKRLDHAANDVKKSAHRNAPKHSVKFHSSFSHSAEIHTT